MKLNASQIRQILNQLEAEVIPDDHPIVNELSEWFGEHTFFLDKTGLNTIEPFDDADDAKVAAQSATVVNLADWTDAQLTSLAPHEPEPTEITVVLATEH